MDYLYRTTNGGITWEDLGAFLASSHGNELSFAFDPVDSMKLYVSGYDNYLYSAFFASYDFGETWSGRSSNVSPNWILVDWNNNNRIYLFAYPMRSEDGGNNWTYLIEPPIQFRIIRSIIDTDNSSILYVSTDAGVYIVTDFDEQWNLIQGSESLDLSFSSGDYPEHLFVDSTTKKLYIGTRQGLYKYDLLTSVEDEKENIPNKFILHQNYPNPFNPSTVISYHLPDGKAGLSEVSDVFVRLIIYDLLGKEVATLVNKPQQSGNYKVTFNGNGLPSGVYIYKLTAGMKSFSRKMLLLK